MLKMTSYTGDSCWSHCIVHFLPIQCIVQRGQSLEINQHHKEEHHHHERRSSASSSPPIAVVPLLCLLLLRTLFAPCNCRFLQLHSPEILCSSQQHQLSSLTTASLQAFIISMGLISIIIRISSNHFWIISTVLQAFTTAFLQAFIISMDIGHKQRQHQDQQHQNHLISSLISFKNQHNQHQHQHKHQYKHQNRQSASMLQAIRHNQQEQNHLSSLTSPNSFFASFLASQSICVVRTRVAFL